MPPRLSLPSPSEVEPIIEDLSPDCAHATLDSVISQAKDFIRSMESLRNAHAKISRLPREVLSTILAMAVEPASYDSEPVPWREHVKITAVCTLWRAIALQTPGFWACIPFQPCKQLPEMIARSRAHPLSVRLHVSPPLALWHQLAPHLPELLNPRRLLDFHLSAEKRIYFSDLTSLTRASLEQFPTVPTPLLRSLKIALNITTTLPIHVLTAPKPSLRHLTLNDVEVDWTALSDSGKIQITSLLSLDLARIRPAIPLPVLYELISSSPDLQSLKILLCLPTDTTSPATHEVSLDSLRSCHLQDPRLDRILGVLQWLKARLLMVIWKIQSAFTYHPNTPFEEADSTRVKSLLSIFGIASDSTLAASLPPYRKLTFIRDPEGPFRMSFTCRHEHQESLSITLSVQAFQTVLTALSLPKLVSLSMGLEDLDASYHVWSYFFRRLPSLQHLRVSSDQAARLFDAALGPTPRISKTLASPFLLQRLALVWIKNTYYQRPKALASSLKIRHAAGLALQQMVIVSCRGFNQKFVEEVEDVVTRFTFDGAFCSNTEDSSDGSETDRGSDSTDDDDDLDDVY